MGNLDEPTKHLVDAAAVTTTFAAFLELLPSIVTLLTGIWVIVRIVESVLNIKYKIRNEKD